MLREAPAPSRSCGGRTPAPSAGWTSVPGVGNLALCALLLTTPDSGPWASRRAPVTPAGPWKDPSWPPRAPRHLSGSPRTASGRISFAKIREPLEVPNLLALQTDSFDWLLGNDKWQARVEAALESGRQDVPTNSGLEEIFEEISPIEDFSGSMSLSFRDHRFEPPKYSIDECKERDMTYSAPLFVTAEFMNNTTGEIKSQTVFMGDFPLMTEQRHLRHQRHRACRRVAARPLAGRLLRAHRRQDLRQGRLQRQDHPVAAVPGSSSRSTSATWSASASTASASSRSRCCSRPSAGARRRSSRSSATSSRCAPPSRRTTPPGQDDALLDIYRKLRPGEPPTREAAQTLLDNLYFNPKRYDLAKVGRYKINKKLGLEQPLAAGVLTIDDIVATIRFLVTLHAGETDDAGHPRRRAGRRARRGRRHRPLRQPPPAHGRRAHPEPGPHGPVPDGARRPRAHDHAGRRGDHAADPDQHPPRRGLHQGVLRHQPAVAVHGPDQPAGRPDPQAPALGARPRRSVP